MNVNDPRWASIDAFVEENRDNILRDITRLVAVPSVEGAPEPGAPFGPGPKAALAKALEIADELGLDTFNADSYIGWAETGRIADGQNFLATITHTDVVPEGNGWDADPYTVRVRDGWLLGRGVADDKGPSILCLYALKYLKDSGAALKYPVRALLGANEETNMHDVDYYAEHYPMPAFCFTPDAEFPVCNGEKGGFNGELVSPKFENGIITAFEGGVAHNAVPDRASCTVQVGAGHRHPRLGQERPRRHARGHGQRHQPDRQLPAQERRLHPAGGGLPERAAHAARRHRRQRAGHCGGRRPV